MSDDLLREFTLQVSRAHPVKIRLAKGLRYPVDDSWITVTKNDRREGSVIINVSLAIFVPKIGAMRSPDTKRRIDNADRGMKAAGRVEFCLLVKSSVSIGIGLICWLRHLWLPSN